MSFFIYYIFFPCPNQWQYICKKKKKHTTVYSVCICWLLRPALLNSCEKVTKCTIGRQRFDNSTHMHTDILVICFSCFAQQTKYKHRDIIREATPTTKAKLYRLWCMFRFTRCSIINYDQWFEIRVALYLVAVLSVVCFASCNYFGLSKGAWLNHIISEWTHMKYLVLQRQETC